MTLKFFIKIDSNLSFSRTISPKSIEDVNKCTHVNYSLSGSAITKTPRDTKNCQLNRKLNEQTFYLGSSGNFVTLSVTVAIGSVGFSNKNDFRM